jgi:hypothetical protein
MKCTVSGEEPVNERSESVPNSATRPDGQHVDHWVMCPGEIIQNGFVRPVRLSYQHVGRPGPEYPLVDLTPEQLQRFAGYVKFEPYPKGARGSALGRYWTQAMLDAIGKGCGTVTSMPRAIAETYAAQPGYYGKTFCCGCRNYLKVGRDGEFVWDGTNDRVGT